jgi:hypothetical protein
MTIDALTSVLIWLPIGAGILLLVASLSRPSRRLRPLLQVVRALLAQPSAISARHIVGQKVAL